MRSKVLVFGIVAVALAAASSVWAVARSNPVNGPQSVQLQPSHSETVECCEECLACCAIDGCCEECLQCCIAMGCGDCVASPSLKADSRSNGNADRRCEFSCKGSSCSK